VLEQQLFIAVLHPTVGSPSTNHKIKNSEKEHRRTSQNYWKKGILTTKKDICYIELWLAVTEKIAEKLEEQK
jgi:hypothetical protein